MLREETTAWLERACPEPSVHHRQLAARRQEQLTKPVGALGRLEDVATTLAGLQSRQYPRADHVPVLVFAGDHGVAARGVSAYPPEVTVQMLANFVHGGAAIAVLSRRLGLPLHVVDVGTAASAPVPGVGTDRMCHGTRDLSVEPAMTDDELDHALGAGSRAVATAAADGADLLVLGEMGIGNTTASAALACLLGDLPVADLVGAGTGVDEQGRRRKQEVLERAVRLHRGAVADADRPARETLRRVGGLEIAALTGAMVAAAQRGIPVLVDGFIVTAAALVATGWNPGVRPWLLFSHRSAERGHGAVLGLLEARPLLDLDLRLGEGVGAAVALPLVRAACTLHSQMATFAEAAVSGRGP